MADMERDRQIDIGTNRCIYTKSTIQKKMNTGETERDTSNTGERER